MAKRILTPIDPREDSEAILPVVAALARDAGSTVRLLRVLPVPTQVVGNHGRIVAFVDQEMERLTAEGLADLQHAEAELVGVPSRRSCASVNRPRKSWSRPRRFTPISSRSRPGAPAGWQRARTRRCRPGGARQRYPHPDAPRLTRAPRASAGRGPLISTGAGPTVRA